MGDAITPVPSSTVGSALTLKLKAAGSLSMPLSGNVSEAIESTFGLAVSESELITSADVWIEGVYVMTAG